MSNVVSFVYETINMLSH